VLATHFIFTAALVGVPVIPSIVQELLHPTRPVIIIGRGRRSEYDWRNVTGRYNAIVVMHRMV
jgi:hypothetical protein